MADHTAVLPAFSFLEQAQDLSTFLERQETSAFPESEKSDFVQRITEIIPRAAAQASGGEDGEVKKEDEGRSLSEEEKKEVARVLVRAVVESKGALSGAEKDVESAHFLLLSILSAAFASESEEEFAKLFQDFIGSVKAGIEAEGSASNKAKISRNEVGLRILSNAYNALPASSPLRATTLMTLLTLLSSTSSSGSTALLSTGLTISQIEQALNAWSIDAEGKRQWLENVAQLYEAGLNKAGADGPEEDEDAPAKLEFALNLRLLSLHLSSSNASASIVSTTTSAILTALRIPTCFSLSSVLSVKGVRENGLDEQTSMLVRLFEEEVELREGLKWVESESAWLGDNGISKDLIIKKLRLLALVSLCAKSTTKEIGYGAIASAMEVEEDDVEAWVIDAVLLNLLTGRLSQPTRTLRIQSTISRSFGASEWTLLSKRLGEWKKALDEVKGVVDEAINIGQRGPSYGQGQDGERRERRQQGGGGQRRDQQQQQQPAAIAAAS